MTASPHFMPTFLGVRGLAGDPGAAVTYAAFLSHSRAVDGRLAPALQRTLERFAKPWYRLRSLRVFLASADVLTANPGLWSSVQGALDASQFFILLASPETARSIWVDKEVAYWVEHKSLTNLLIVLTDGEIVWDSFASDFDWDKTTALPGVLRGRFTEEPRWVDLRWVRNEWHLSTTHGRFLDVVAELAAPLHGRTKDDLAGEHVRRQRRRATTGLLVTLSAGVGSVLGAVGAMAFDLSSAQTQEFGGIPTELVISGSVGLFLLGVALAGRQLVSNWRAKSRPSVTAEELVKRRTEDLNDALRAVTVIADQLQKEAETAHERVEQLKHDAATYEQLAAVNQAQADALARLVQGQVQAENQRSFRANLVQNGVFFILGTAAGALIQVLLG